MGIVTAICQRGHVMDESNTYRPPNGRPRCRACRRIADTIRGPRGSRSVPPLLDRVVLDRILHHQPVSIRAVDKPLLAHALADRGWTRGLIADALHASGSSVHRWLDQEKKAA